MFSYVKESGPEILHSTKGALSRSWPSPCSNECESDPENLKNQRGFIKGRQCKIKELSYLIFNVVKA